MRNAFVFFVIAVAGYFIWSHFRHPAGPPGGMMEMPPAQVEVAEVTAREVQLWNEFSGRLSAVDAAEIRPRVSGPVESVNFKNGASVQKGELLFVIDQKPYKSEVDRLKGLLASAEAQEALAQTEFSRAEGLFQSKAISQREFDQRRNDLNVAKAAQKSAEAALEAAQLNLDYTEVRAPISGRAGRAEVTVGNMVQAGPNAPMLTMIASITPIYADFEMDEATYLRYAKVTAAERARIPCKLGLAADKDTPHEGHIDSFDNRLDSASGTIRVRALFDNNDGALVPGLFARIRIADAAPSKVLLINDRAVGTDQDKKYVLAVNAENKAEYRQVKLGPPAEGLRVVEEGLNAGDKIIISGLLVTMRPGMPVVPQLVAMDAPPQAPPAQTPDTGNIKSSTDDAAPLENKKAGDEKK
ncbi:MAG: efflux RND transporter periplasmic adaptor subunit [Alphaproteobacteria bacterium]